MTPLQPGIAVAVAAVQLTPDVTQDGAPATGLAPLAHIGGCHIGVWEHAPGVSDAVEEDEVFVVVAGEATIHFVDSDLPDLSIAAGDLVRLAAGARTVWNVTTTLRKVYVSPVDQELNHDR